MQGESAPQFRVIDTDDGRTLMVSGDWTIATIADVDGLLRKALADEEGLAIDLSGIGLMDTSGAYVIERAMRGENRDHDIEAKLIPTDHPYAGLLAEVAEASRQPPLQPPPVVPPFLEALARLGKGAVSAWRETLGTLAFLGEALTRLVANLFHPRRMRWTSVIAIAEEAGLDAMPIVAFLSFFVGMVVAFIGATALADFGASIFVVELVGISVLREFGIIITAIILAGRTNSAFTAQIGAMKMRQEIDALEVIGLKPMDVLVVPRVMAMLIMVPILALVATISGVLGGIVVAWAALDITPGFFLNRLLEGVPITNLWVGLSKSPVVALIVALIGCRQGLNVGNSVISLGQATTTSVVQAIFAIIVMDALFALFYMELDI